MSWVVFVSFFSYLLYLQDLKNIANKAVARAVIEGGGGGTFIIRVLPDEFF